ncbi:hypothetical protein HII31_09621 [Pseudocercospora fuligena]|uniref:Uncharacterized protein n=1 Tax=Pseudocercospora fuligena TaxID=685502 RepID=A0A8H6RE01_9PEZI|nr:hypothetical protein HII31_09621 [Pseudocercospora fuligena]
MAPSRAAIPSETSPDETAVAQQSSSAYKNARRNFNYLINPGTSDQPGRFRTRALLRTLRYISQFVIWRLVRWAKYAAVAFAVATVGGTLVSGAGFVLAPTGIAGSIVAASVWGIGKYIARKAHNRWKDSGGDVGNAARERAGDEARDRRLVTDSTEVGASAVPW